MIMELDLTPEKSRGYRKCHTSENVFKQVKDVGKINNEKPTFVVRLRRRDINH